MRQSQFDNRPNCVRSIEHVWHSPLQPDTRNISELRNLGPACEANLNAVGIHTADDLKRLGPEAAFNRMLSGRKLSGRSSECCNAAYLYALHGAIHDIDWRELPETKIEQFKALTAEIRQSGCFA